VKAVESKEYEIQVQVNKKVDVKINLGRPAKTNNLF
jgi:hypothetical protein